MSRSTHTTAMSAADDYPRLAWWATSLWYAAREEFAEALDEIDRLRRMCGVHAEDWATAELGWAIWGSDCMECGNATPNSQVCDACDSDEFTVPLYWNAPMRAVKSEVPS